MWWLWRRRACEAYGGQSVRRLLRRGRRSRASGNASGEQECLTPRKHASGPVAEAPSAGHGVASWRRIAAPLAGIALPAMSFSSRLARQTTPSSASCSKRSASAPRWPRETHTLVLAHWLPSCRSTWHGRETAAKHGGVFLRHFRARAGQVASRQKARAASRHAPARESRSRLPVTGYAHASPCTSCGHMLGPPCSTCGRLMGPVLCLLLDLETAVGKWHSATGGGKRKAQANVHAALLALWDERENGWRRESASGRRGSDGRDPDSDSEASRPAQVGHPLAGPPCPPEQSEMDLVTPSS